jgi:hypothetical protein
MKYESSSSVNGLIANAKGAHILNPWRIIIDTDEETIAIVKRNSILIGVNERIVSFGFIREITINQHIIGADIHVKVIGGMVSAYCIPKSDAAFIKQILLEYNKTKKRKQIVFA